jgi:deoxyribose-phosphate aldolase
MSSTTTAPKTDAEWTSLISRTKASLGTTTTNTQKFKENNPLATSPSSVASTIDHTLLALSATEAQVDTLCAEAKEHQFATVCVRLNFVSHAVQNLKSHKPDVGVACVVGFHEGTQSSADKALEAKQAVERGASELDMVINRTLLTAGKYEGVYDDIVAVRQVAPSSQLKLKVILETARLDVDEIIAGSVISCVAGADFIKTSTGFDGPGATVENVALMRSVADSFGKGVKVKASGGVRTADDAIKMLQAGAERIGASAGVKIVKDMEGNGPSEQNDPSGSY